MIKGVGKSQEATLKSFEIQCLVGEKFSLYILGNGIWGIILRLLLRYRICRMQVSVMDAELSRLAELLDSRVQKRVCRELWDSFAGVNSICLSTLLVFWKLKSYYAQDLLQFLLCSVRRLQKKTNAAKPEILICKYSVAVSCWYSLPVSCQYSEPL